MSDKARQVILQAEVVVGYRTYIELITELLGGKQIVSTGMMQEIDRCRAAVEIAIEGKRVTVVSSGDPGIYGMAGLVYEIVAQYPENIRPEVTVIPGISAVNAAAAVLGAPLMHDFAVISLSDLLTPWEMIQKRVEMAGSADFVIALYNPKSLKRTTQIEEVRKILLRHRSPLTPVGIVGHASRMGQRAVISSLERFTQEHIDMFSLVIIGNSQTFVQDGRMITPRGYTL
ncbi:Cobalt-precorrin-3B C(17)-methyltransferase [Propionispora sp. 2/2-37]|uniref:precorrin-3B C(17)-methyltransferase n=1 Tax=Propionispora sp. 2/2-37 TaxID=1677858 RepID=UPI0006BB7696|nr:precorrin-3B C(17)-methyltransferase [Propionispora sp. 2/2-37]CUH94010.1 Cobalt-precorrin-3B C(17)-methyltransferase [Propionispora sp. 2/2-37]